MGFANVVTSNGTKKVHILYSYYRWTPMYVMNVQVFDFNISDAHMAQLNNLNDGWVCGWNPTTER